MSVALDLEPLANSRLLAVAVVFLVWTVIYLPGLGSIEIKGEEGRRILPAIRMLETGDYIVPELGSYPYYRKPPLVNWVVAGSFKVFGVHNEWTARLPSALAVLAVAVAFVTVARACLGSKGSMVAALIWMTNIGMIEKGRLIEIEALYVSLCGLAIIFWLSFFLQKKSPWLIWLPALVFLGLGLLAKGPTHLVFFYGIVVAVLWRGKDWCALRHPAHFVALVIMVGIFAAWAIPFLHSTTIQVGMDKWSGQYTGRLRGTDFKFFSWIQNIPRSLVYFLPWLLLLPFVRFSRLQDEAQRGLACALAWGIAVPFLAVNLVPGAVPRYAMPSIVPACWLLAMSYAGNALRWPERMATWGNSAWTNVIAAFVGLGILIGAVGYPNTAQILRNRQEVKLAATTLNNAIPAGETLYAVNPDYQPVFFYLSAPVKYVNYIKQLPANTHYFLVQPADQVEATAAQKFAPLRAYPVAYIHTPGQREIILFKVEQQGKRERGGLGS